MTVSYEPVKSGKGGKVYGIAFYVELNGGKEKKNRRKERTGVNVK